MLPMVLVLIFVGLFVWWAQLNDERQRSAFQSILMIDAQSVQTQLAARQDFERAKLHEAADRLGKAGFAGDDQLQSMPEVVAGLDRLWNRLVWIDEDMRVVARTSRVAKALKPATDGLRIEAAGQADHFVASVVRADGQPAGRLLARYDITELLQGTDLAWLNRRYQVDFVTDLGEVIATTANTNAARHPEATPFEIPITAFKDTTLRLTPFESPVSWHHSATTLALLGGLLLLGVGASHRLRREMIRVANAVLVAKTEAVWRQSMEDSALVGLRARDLEGRILYVNRTLCEMVGYTRDELVGLLPPLPFWPPEAIDDLMARNMDTLAGASPTEGFETRWKHSDGHFVDVVVFESPLVNVKGRHIGWMGSIVDVSERKRLQENERRHLEAMAQHARLNDLGLIASELAHELNQPLTSITSYAAGLNIALSKRLPNEQELLDALNAVQRNAKKAGDIVNWIRGQTSRTIAPRLPCDLNAVVSDALEPRLHQIRRLNIQVHQNLAPQLPQMVVDRIGLEQLISNLVRNAIDALAEKTGDRCIHIETHQLQNDAGESVKAYVLVRDNGPGLQGRTIDTLCSTFYSTKKNGMGLGLGICRAIAEAHGGTLGAQDALSGGAEFVLTIPVSNNISQEETV